MENSASKNKHGITPKKLVISTTTCRKKLDNGNLSRMKMVVYITPIGRKKGVMKYNSKTVHEIAI